MPKKFEILQFNLKLEVHFWCEISSHSIFCLQLTHTPRPLTTSEAVEANLE